ncbi:MAG: dihydrofolate reductase, partial [Bacteroidetes bacterium]
MRQYFLFLALAAGLFFGCEMPSSPAETAEEPTTETFNWNPENFSDKKIIRYQIPGFDQLSLQQKKLVYYLTQAGLAGRDITYDQNYRHNLSIRRCLEHIIQNYSGDKTTDDWKNLVLYAKEVWFANGIHHHYSSDKFMPMFSEEYFRKLMAETGAKLSEEALEAMFVADKDPKKVNLDPTKDLVLASAVNFYDPDIKEAEVDAYYAKIIDPNDETPISYGLNTKMVRDADGSVKEVTYSANGMYAPAIREIIK